MADASNGYEHEDDEEMASLNVDIAKDYLFIFPNDKGVIHKIKEKTGSDLYSLYRVVNGKDEDYIGYLSHDQIVACDQFKANTAPSPIQEDMASTSSKVPPHLVGRNFSFDKQASQSNISAMSSTGGNSPHHK